MYQVYDLDICNGHAANGDYHHHHYPICLQRTLNDTGADGHSPIYGWVLDSYPLYGPYNDVNTLATPCWQKRDYSSTETGCTDGTRSCVLVDEFDYTQGTTLLSSSQYGPSLTGTVDTQSGNTVSAATGIYYEDYFYNASCKAQSEEKFLDEHNGHSHGEYGYHYHFTIDEAGGAVMPYLIGPQFKGCISAESASRRRLLNDNLRGHIHNGHIHNNLGPPPPPQSSTSCCSSIMSGQCTLMSVCGVSTDPTASPTLIPSAQPTLPPTNAAAIGTTYLSFNSAFSMSNVNISDFIDDDASQTAARNATASSMPGVELDQVIIINVSDTSTRRKLADSLLLSRVLITNSIYITFTTTVSTQQFGFTEQDANALFANLTDQLSTAVSDGAYNTYLSTASDALSASAMVSASAQTPVTSQVDDIVTTTADDDSGSKGDNDSNELIYIIVGCGLFVVAICIMLVFIPGSPFGKYVATTASDVEMNGMSLPVFLYESVMLVAYIL